MIYGLDYKCAVQCGKFVSWFWFDQSLQHWSVFVLVARSTPDGALKISGCLQELERGQALNLILQVVTVVVGS